MKKKINSIDLSVIIPTYNRADVVMRAVKSAISQKQHNLNYEVVVYDDGSTDSTAEIFNNSYLRKVRFIPSKHGNRGSNFARNRAIDNARGKFYLFLDSDDELLPNAFSNIERLISSYNIDIMFLGTVEEKTGKKMYYLSRNGFFNYPTFLKAKSIGGELIVVARSEFFKRFRFEEKIKYTFEGLLWNKIIRETGCYGFDIPIRKYYFGAQNRITRLIFKPQNFKMRENDYRLFLEEVEEDCKNFGYYQKLIYLKFMHKSYLILSRVFK